MTRYIAITDIHGELYKLESVLSKIKTEKDDIFVFMGDYIDRGKYSKEVIDRIIELNNYNKCIYLMGSHEYAYLQARQGKDYYQFLFDNYGGPATEKSYGGFENIYQTHKNFFDNLKFYYLTDKYLFVHAGINPDYPLEEQNEEDLVYIRGKYLHSKTNLAQKVISGHTEFDVPFIREDKICIDLGCGKYPDAKLCALILDEENNNESFIYSD